ncbi:MAG: hypothetical protein ACPHXR_01780 [Flavicella sp.]
MKINISVFLLWICFCTSLTFGQELKTNQKESDAEIIFSADTQVLGDLEASSLYGNLTGDVTGNLTGNVTGDVTGDVTGNLTGDSTGKHTGEVVGNVTGDVNGNLEGNVSASSVTISSLLRLPTFTEEERNTIGSPVFGQLLLCSDCKTNGEIQYYNGDNWVNMLGGTAATSVIPDSSNGSVTGAGQIIYSMGNSSYELGQFYYFDTNTKMFTTTNIDVYKSSSYQYSIPFLGNGFTYFVNSSTSISKITGANTNKEIAIPSGYTASLTYSGAQQFSSDIGGYPVILLKSTSDTNLHYPAYINEEDEILVMNSVPMREYSGFLNGVMLNGYFIFSEDTSNNTKYIVNLNAENPSPIKITFPVQDNSSYASSITFGDGMFYFSYKDNSKSNSDYNKILYRLDPNSLISDNSYSTTMITETSSRMNNISFASNGKIYFSDDYRPNSEPYTFNSYNTNDGVLESINLPTSVTRMSIIKSNGKVIEFNGKLVCYAYNQSWSNSSTRYRLYLFDTTNNTFENLFDENYSLQGYCSVGDYNIPTGYKPVIVHQGKLYITLRYNEYDNHRFLIYDGENKEIIKPNVKGGGALFSESCGP